MVTVLAVTVWLMTASVGGAQVPIGDAATGTGDTIEPSFGIGYTFEFSATSGRVGENPAGQAFVGCCTSATPNSVDGPVTCLSVSGNFAVIGVRNVTGLGGFAFAEIVATDRTPLGLPDLFTADPLSLPADCVASPGVGSFVTHGGIEVVDAPPLPSAKDQCLNGGWRTYGVFKNQGDCVSFVATGGKNPPAG